MRTIILAIIFAICSIAARAQSTSLYENFNTSCSSGTGSFPTDWTYYNPITTTTPNGAWQCTSTGGRNGTPGIECSGIWGSPSTDNLDTSYLITPALNLSTYPGNVYINFDSKTTRIVLGGRMSLLVSTDSTFTTGVFDLTDSVSPVFTEDDSAGWVTHQANITSFKTMAPLFIAFLYTSSTTSGSVWYLDNILTTPYPLSVSNPSERSLPLTVIGNSSPQQIKISYTTESEGIYHITIYDILGHKAYESDMNTSPGNTIYTIDDLQLHSGMYLIKIGNGLIYGTTKTIIP